jgi:hypothetical protein
MTPRVECETEDYRSGMEISRRGSRRAASNPTARAYGRNLAGYPARKLVGFRAKEIVQHFQREPMTISLGVKKVEKLLQRDRDFSRPLEIKVKGT